MPVIYDDGRVVAVHKPAGWLVHRTALARDTDHALLGVLRDQLGQRLHPLHRLDRPTSGVMLFARDRETASALGLAFRSGLVHKRYLVLARGHMAATLCNHPLRRDDGRAPQAATTRFTPLAQLTLPVATSRYPQTRWSLVCAQPLTGRMHQIRRHLKHLSHHPIGDTTYGKGDHNRLLAERYGLQGVVLHALQIDAPLADGTRLCAVAAPPASWSKLLRDFDVDLSTVLALARRLPPVESTSTYLTTEE